MSAELFIMEHRYSRSYKNVYLINIDQEKNIF